MNWKINICEGDIFPKNEKLELSRIKLFWIENWNVQKKQRTWACANWITAPRWKSYFHYHQVPILNQNQTSIYKEHFPWGTSSYQHGSVNEKHIQRGQCHKKVVVPLGQGLPTHQYGNERWTVNMVPARITRRAGAPSSMNLFFLKLSKKTKFRQNTSTF